MHGAGAVDDGHVVRGVAVQVGQHVHRRREPRLSQPNLTADWVTQTVAQGWTLIPTYVGSAGALRQQHSHHRSHRPCAGAGTGRRGRRRRDRSAQRRSGLGLGNPVYFDMEGLPVGSANAACNAAVLAFEDAWTARLHARGYVSGVYASSGSTVAQLVAQQSNPTFHQPDDIWFARWPSDSKTQPGDPTLSDPAIPDQYWADHQRIHQYRGGHTET